MAYDKQNQSTRKSATQNMSQNSATGQSDTEFAADTASGSQGAQGVQGAGNVSKIPNRRG